MWKSHKEYGGDEYQYGISSGMVSTKPKEDGNIKMRTVVPCH